MTETEYRLELPPEPASAAAARRFVVQSVGDKAIDLGLAELLVSELASNAILHARTAFTVSVVVADGCVRFTVLDDDQTIPAAKPYAADAVTGRGLSIVASSSDRWGVEARPFGKAVWFELATKAAAR